MRNPFRGLFSRKSMDLSNPALAMFFGSIPTASGIAVNAESAMRVPAVACAVMAISDAAGQLPVHVYKRDADATKDRDTNHPAYALVHDDANPWRSAGQLRQTLTIDALTKGNGFAAVVRADDVPRELHRLCPDTTRIEIADNGEPTYIHTRTSGGEQRYSYEDIIHIPAPFTKADGYTGIAPIHLAREAIGLALILEGHAARLFSRGARPSGVLKHPKILGEAAHKRLQSALTEHAGSGSGSTFVLEEGLSWEPIALNSVDAQYLEQRRFAIEEIARVFRVPPHMLMELGRATWGNASEMGQSFLTYTLAPWLRRWESAFRRTLLTEDERKTHVIEFLVDDFARADISKRMAAYQTAVGGPFLTPNEVRASENRPALPGGDSLRTVAVATAANDNFQDIAA